MSSITKERIAALVAENEQLRGDNTLLEARIKALKALVTRLQQDCQCTRCHEPNELTAQVLRRIEAKIEHGEAASR
jgi:hypothetical protein